jgi:hypothetical protein
MLKKIVALLALLVVVSCGGSSTEPGVTGVSLSGQVTSALTSVAIAGATVAIADGPDAGKTATTDASGNYRFDGLQPSSVTASASASGFQDQSKSVGLTSSQSLSFQLAGVRTPIFNRTQTVRSHRGNGNSFTIPRLGRVDIETSWTRASNLVRLEVAFSAVCGAPQYVTNTCVFLQTDRSAVATPQRSMRIESLAPGDYIAWVTNQGATDETLTIDVYLTP